jgi:hypothetical protein
MKLNLAEATTAENIFAIVFKEIMLIGNVKQKQ